MRRRTLSPKEAIREAFEAGQMRAYRNVLIEMGTGQKVSEVRKRLRLMLSFLERERLEGGKLWQKQDTSIWEDRFHFTLDELANLTMLQIHDYQARLTKARKVHEVNTRLLQEACQLTID